MLIANNIKSADIPEDISLMKGKVYMTKFIMKKCQGLKKVNINVIERII